MPKLIKNVREELLRVARGQLMRLGYAKTTMRSVAGECGLAVGTVYNYFESKDMLIATFVADDWRDISREISAFSKESSREFFKFVYDSLVKFSEAHDYLFRDRDAAVVFSSVQRKWHGYLQDQLAHEIALIDDVKRSHNSELLSKFLAESLLYWTMDGMDFEILYSILARLI